MYKLWGHSFNTQSIIRLALLPQMPPFSHKFHQTVAEEGKSDTDSTRRIVLYSRVHTTVSQYKFSGDGAEIKPFGCFFFFFFFNFVDVQMNAIEFA